MNEEENPDLELNLSPVFMTQLQFACFSSSIYPLSSKYNEVALSCGLSPGLLILISSLVLRCEEHVKSASPKFLTDPLTDVQSDCSSTSYWTEAGGYFGLRASPLTFCSCAGTRFDVSLPFYEPDRQKSEQRG